MRSEYLHNRNRLPRVASKIRIVRLFQKELPIEYIAGLLGCFPNVIEDVIRKAMTREARAK